MDAGECMALIVILYDIDNSRGVYLFRKCGNSIVENMDECRPCYEDFELQAINRLGKK